MKSRLLRSFPHSSMSVVWILFSQLESLKCLAPCKKIFNEILLYTFFYSIPAKKILSTSHFSLLLPLNLLKLFNVICKHIYKLLKMVRKNLLILLQRNSKCLHQQKPAYLLTLFIYYLYFFSLRCSLRDLSTAEGWLFQYFFLWLLMKKVSFILLQNIQVAASLFGK